ncbi:RNA polymerase sigma factor [Maricaulis sp. CAU 1757]
MRGDASDAALVAAARAGSDAAFGQIVDRYQKPVRAFVWRLCGDPADADDIAQDVFLAAWTRLRGLKEADRLKAWLFSIAWRKAKGAARSRVRARQRETSWQVERPDRADRADEVQLAMQQALAQLPAAQRAAVALCLGNGWSHADAAEILNLPLGTVKSHVTRGRARLVEILGDDNDAA